MLRGRSHGEGVNLPGRGGEEAYGDNLIAHSLRAQGQLAHREDVDTYVLASAVSASAGHHGHSSPRGDGSDNLVADQIGTITANWHKGAGNTQVEMGIVQPTPQGVRRLTPLECERLMSWPDGWTRYADDGSEIPDSHRYRLCGNGVVSTCAEWIGRRLVAVDATL